MTPRPALVRWLAGGAIECPVCKKFSAEGDDICGHYDELGELIQAHLEEALSTEAN